MRIIKALVLNTLPQKLISKSWYKHQKDFAKFNIECDKKEFHEDKRGKNEIFESFWLGQGLEPRNQTPL